MGCVYTTWMTMRFDRVQHLFSEEGDYICRITPVVNYKSCGMSEAVAV
jgi:hypothetical protein